jgi:hypothetical protein
MSGSVVDTPLEQVRRRLDAATLRPHVRQVVGRQQAEVVSWSCEILHGGGGALFDEGALGVFRVYGAAQDGTERLPWSLILKIVTGSRGEESAASSRYWKREALAYQSGLLRTLPSDLSAPTCYGVTEVPARTEGMEEAWIWLEEITQRDKQPWTPARLQQAARALGHFNGAYLSQDLRSTYPWLSQGHVQEWMTLSESVLLDLEQYRQHPFVATWLSVESMRRLHTLWQAREALLTHFQRQPRTLCHHDAFVRNLLLKSTAMGEQVVAIDWSFIGMGALGEEIALLVGISHRWLDLDVVNLREVEEHVWAGYLTGLHDAGWQGDVQSVRFAYAATSALLGASGCISTPFIVEHMELVEELFGHSAAEMAAAWPQLLRHQLDLGEEALRLAGSA